MHTAKGSTALPGYSFNDDVNTGLNSDGADVVSLVAGGVEVLRVNSSAAPMALSSTYKLPQIVEVPLAAVDTAGGVFAWQNPTGVDIIVNRVTIRTTTESTGACTLDVGTTATSATTLSDNLIDGLSVASAAGVFDNLGNAGTNGKTRHTLAAGKWVTASVASGASAGLVGSAFIEYFVA